jgi:hypothetical protein
MPSAARRAALGEQRARRLADEEADGASPCTMPKPMPTANMPPTAAAPCGLPFLPACSGRRPFGKSSESASAAGAKSR